MKTIIRLPLALTLGAPLALGLVGCGKDESATSTTEDTNKAAVTASDAAGTTAEAAQVEAQKAADAAKAEAAGTAEAVKTEVATVEAAKTAEATNASDNTRTQGLIERVKSLVADGKFSDASSVLQQLTGQTLSGDQTKLVESLKEQIQKALAAKAASGTTGDLLKQ